MSPSLSRILREAHCLNGRARFCLYEYVVFTTKFGSEQAVGSCGKECLGKSNDLINGECGCPIKINSSLMDGFDFIGTRDRLNSSAEEWAVTAELFAMGSMCFRCSVSLGDHSVPHIFPSCAKGESEFPKANNSDASTVISLLKFCNFCFPKAVSEVNCLSSSHQRWVALLPSQHAKDHVCSIIHSRCINATFLSALLLQRVSADYRWLSTGNSTINYKSRRLRLLYLHVPVADLTQTQP